jgi:hypothetical protein
LARFELITTVVKQMIQSLSRTELPAAVLFNRVLTRSTHLIIELETAFVNTQDVGLHNIVVCFLR